MTFDFQDDGRCDEILLLGFGLVDVTIEGQYLSANRISSG